MKPRQMRSDRTFPGRRAVLRAASGVAASAVAASAVSGCVGARPPAQPSDPGDGPLTSADLVGKTLRVYHTGDPLTRDFRQDRANVELGPDERIVAIWIG